ncbi:MAG: UDP-N-acetylmuramoyl-tripeptide--D-alanyl-D-alanine ligase [Liquorilactobacillus hordei]|uniref:UDP-N-acetylmuramoyl-tripeptide--D-alanyl-D-alanine ligase n=1 Tax=Liquorilactobacillus hordei TaxID=468911 RepID=A0A3S6QSD3_9LACO|nr:UDP-N-acetylmuramoyl-tripeptide--D-alanyl-D-alanine ligase [Liquorilactobacillus hordei]AUJ29177.1 UDP-N-acetylmuramoyl-tripeptide--D-alanyl-D-alanine ligase [Liquorilactobacillus hordei]MBZ2406570.1 UDP-N-acetylmuramoyl-tripeptide--D-alanyl-D-alanine ligase [Liquorilactobacillus hordei]
MKMRLAEIAKALQVEPKEEWEEIVVTSVSFDTRSLEQGALFIPLVAEHDGHDYIENAIKKGAVATLWQEDHDENTALIPKLVVSNSLQAMQKLAHYYLQKINPKVVAITGSNGKTTTKDMVAAILGRRFNVQKTHDNFNNFIGVPMTVLSMEPNTEVLVIEMGMDHFGELDELSHLVEPDIAVITMIGEAHIEFFGTRDKIADAKMEITHGLKEDGVLIYNGDEPLLIQRTKEIAQETNTFGTSDNVNLRALNVVSNDEKTSFRVVQWENENFVIPMIGSYNVINALAALSVGKLFRIPVEEMKKALKSFELTKNRTQWLQGAKGEQILSDVYNSNPSAAKLVIKAFSNASTKGKRMIVIGDMLQLGISSKEMHESLAEVIDPDKIDSVYLCGEEVEPLATKLVSKFDKEHLHLYKATEKKELVADLQSEISADDSVLLKGSHGIHLENVLEKLV